MAAEEPIIVAFQSAAAEVPAYREILAQAGADPAQVRTPDDFRRRVPVLDKKMTFGRFGVAELCRGGRLGNLAYVLTSSGHSGQFAFGLYGAEETETAAARLDAAVEQLFQVSARPALLINCLPMGVKVYTRACTLGETSVRADMVTALVREFGPHYQQIIMIGETAFIKRALELGCEQGLDWRKFLVHVVVGEEPLAENARYYLESLLRGGPAALPGSATKCEPAGGTESAAGGGQRGLILSSMGVAELGLNLFFELPQTVVLRRALHCHPDLRRRVLGPQARAVPTIFTYDPSRILVEVDAARRLVLSTLDPRNRLPLIRYATGDEALLLTPEQVAEMAGGAAAPAEWLADWPLLMVLGRGQHAMATTGPVYPEEIKEGLYADHELARLVTANFRLASGPPRARLRIQLSPGVRPEASLVKRFAEVMARYTAAPLEISCESYESFGSGMELDYERKFDYLGK